MCILHARGAESKDKRYGFSGEGMIWFCHGCAIISLLVVWIYSDFGKGKREGEEGLASKYKGNGGPFSFAAASIAAERCVLG